MPNSMRYANDRVTLRWVLLVTLILAACGLVAQGVYLSQQFKTPIEFLGQ